MKKQYIIPTMDVVKIHATVILADSFTKNANGDLTGGKLIDDNATGAGMSRFFDWDDEEED